MERLSETQPGEPLTAAPPYAVCRVAGTPRERGLAYGRWVREKLHVFVEEELYQAMATRHRLGGEEIAAYAEACLPHIRRDTPRTWSFLEGLSEGAGIGVQELAAVLAHEEYYHGHPVSHHCSGLAVSSRETRDGQTYIGQTWDWMESMVPYRHLLHQTAENGQRTLSYAYPGLWTAAGISTSGMALVWVGAGYDHASKHGGRARPGVPAYALIAEMLEQPSFDAAVACALEARHAGWFIFLLAGRDGQLARVEAAPDAKSHLRPTSLAAANIMYTDEQVRRASQQDEPGLPPPHWAKYARMCELLLSYSGRLDRETLFGFMRNHVAEPKWASICGHNGTLDGFLFSPSSNQAWFIPGPPCRHEAQAFEL